MEKGEPATHSLHISTILLEAIPLHYLTFVNQLIPASLMVILSVVATAFTSVTEKKTLVGDFAKLRG